jgi:predicted DNA repair protein MutK
MMWHVLSRKLTETEIILSTPIGFITLGTTAKANALRQRVLLAATNLGSLLNDIAVMANMVAEDATGYLIEQQYGLAANGQGTATGQGLALYTWASNLVAAVQGANLPAMVNAVG